MNGASSLDAWQQLVASHRHVAVPDLDIDPWAPSLVSFTSGTTGIPKGVVHSQHNAILVGAGAVQRGQWDIGLRRGSAQALTINNIMIRFAAASLYAGAAFVCMDRLDAEGTVEWVAREKIQAFRRCRR
jgi:long-chain acyl-CoA synthetase